MSKTLAYVGLVMSVIFVVIAILISVSPPDHEFFHENPNMRFVLSAIILMYGLFRLQRSLKILQQHKNR